MNKGKSAMKYKRWLVGLLLLTMAVWPSQAQPLRTLAINGGVVYVNGERVAADALPASLDPTGLTLNMSFSGLADPVVQISGAFYRLEEGRLLEVTADEVTTDALTVFFSGGAREQARPLLRAMDAPEVWVMQPPGEALPSRKARFRANLEQPLPAIEVRGYLTEVQEQNTQLYERLEREWQWEADTHRLVSELFSLPPGPARAAKVTELRSFLEEVFDLKQQNRRREIERFEAKLEDLRRRLAERESLREQVIQRRFVELMETYRPRE